MKKFSKRYYLIILALLVAAVLVPLLSFASAATVASGSGTWVSGQLDYTWAATSNGTTANGAAGTVTVSSGQLIPTATNSKEVSGCSTTAAEATTTTVTVTNASGYPLYIRTLTYNANTSVSGVAQGDTIAPNATFKVTVTAPAVSSSTKVSGAVSIVAEAQTSVTITLAPSPYVGYTVDGHAVAQNGSEVSFSADAGATYSLPSITAPAGYEFKGWRVGSTMTTASSFTADAAYTVFPVIVTEGMDLTAANFKVGNKTYTFWEDAIVAALGGDGKVFVNLEEVTLPDNVLDNLLPASGGTYVKPTADGVEYIVPGGVTVVVPKDTSTTVHTTAPAYEYAAHVMQTPFRTLYVPNGAKITVNGAISIDSKACATGQNTGSWNGTPTGPHGKIVLRTGSEIELNSGANLYCWGYINGDGTVTVNSGATVFEMFQFRDWRGGTATNNMADNSNRVFPMNQYYVQNVEAPMTIYKGATEKVWTAVNMSSSAYPASSIEFIGANGMFKLTGGSSDYITKRYHANVDQLEIAAHGDMSLNALNVTISGLPLIGSITMQSKNYVLPLNNMNVVVESGTTSIASSQTHGVAFLPSSKLTVNEGAAFSVNAPTYFYDNDDWGPYACDSGRMVPVGYSTANGSTAIRTADNLKDAELNVNGSVNVSNKLYTTARGAHITSSEGTGVINFTAACATGTTTTYQATQSGSNISYEAITCNNAWLQNGDETYDYTVSTGTSTWYYDKDGENWYRYKVDVVFNGNNIARGYYCENNDTLTYDADWLTDLGASVTGGNATTAISGTNVVITDVTANSVVTLTGVPAEYAPTFVLNEAEYAHYQMYTGQTLENTVTINDVTYYVVDQGETLPVGTAYAAPTDAAMGETAENHNEFLWNLSGVSFTSGDPYRGFVPTGETAGGPAYIYGFYTGAVAYNSYTDAYYPTLHDAFIVLPQDVSATITMLADCGTFEEESATTAYTSYDANNITLDLNGYHAVGRILNRGNFTLEMNGGELEYHTGSTAIAAAYNGLAAIVNSGAMTIRDTVGGGKISADATSNTSGSNGTAIIRNNAGAVLSITGKSSDDMLTLLECQNEVAYNKDYGYYAYNYGIYNLGRISALTNVDITATHSRTTGVNIYNYNTGVIENITDCHMYSYSGSSVFNYGGAITKLERVTIDGKNGVTNYNIRGGSQAAGWTVAEADKGVINLINDCHIEVGQYAINNNAVINTLSNSTFIAHPDTAQVDTRGDGLATVCESNTTPAYTVYNSANWWYNTNIWKRVDTTSAPFTRTDTYKEEEQYRPHIGTITNCEIYAENTTNSASYGDYALVNYGVIDTIGGTTNIKTYKHPNNTASITTSHYTLHNLGGGIIKSIEGTVNVSATGIGTIYNTGVFTLQTVNTYNGKIGGNLLTQVYDYGDPSTIESVTCAGTWTCGSYYVLYNTGHIQTINAPELTLRSAASGYNVLYNSYETVNKHIDFYCEYTDPATASTAHHRHAEYTKNTEKSCRIDMLKGVTIEGKYNVLVNGGHIGTLSDVTVSNTATSNDPTFVNGAADSNYGYYASITEDRKNVASYAEDYPNVTISAGYSTRYDREYTYEPATIDVIDNLTLTSTGQYALRNMGAIGTLKNSTITATTNYALHNSDYGPLTEKTSVQYYSGTSIWATTKYTSDIAKHYLRDPATIGTIDNCTIRTNTAAYAAYNAGHIGTIKNSAVQAGATTAAAYALANTGNCVREYTRDLETGLYITANGGTACTSYWGSGGESNIVTYDYDAPTVDLIGEGNTFEGTTNVIANTGVITAIDSGEGTLTTITGSKARGNTIYNYSAGLDARTTTTPYTAAETLPASGTKGTAVNDDTLLPGAQIGTIKNVYIDANGYGILNGDANASYLPVIGEIGEGTEIYAHCTTAAYHAIANNNYAEITSITGGVFTVTKATTNAYLNGYNVEGAEEHATLISGGYFKGMSNTRANAIYKPDNTSRQTYPQGYTLSEDTQSVTLHDGTTATGYYYIKQNATFTVTWKNEDGTVLETDENVASGETPAYDGETPVKAADATYHYTFSGWDPTPAALSDDAVYTAQFTPTAHTWNAGTVTTAATCTTAGVKTLTCTVCGQTTTETIAALGHDLVTDAAVAATCTETGLTEGSHCTRCDYAVAQETVPALGHDMITDAAVAATCTETGLTAGEHCSRCDYAVAQETVPALGHDMVEDAAVPASCTEPGLTAGSHCSRCDYAVAQETVPALGHDMVEDAAVPASCTEPGLTAGSHCSRCDYAVAQETVPALGHDIVTDAASTATCTEPGLTAGEHCTRCDYAVAQTEVPALGHDYVDHEAQAASCTEAGWNAYQTCTRCDYTSYAEIPALGHDYVDHEAQAASCTEAGWNAYQTCSRCDYSTYEEIPALGHDIVEDAASTATCTEPGLTAGEHCTRCDYAVAQTEVPALGHDIIADAAVEATCTEPGLTAGEHCSRCDYAVAQEVIPALGHSLEEHPYAAPTCTEPGSYSYSVCTRCGGLFDDGEQLDPEEQVIPALGHDLVHHEAKEPTCAEAGWAEYDTCSRCDYTTYEEIPALEDHVYENGYCIYCGVGDGTDTSFKVASAKLTISKDIVVTYGAAVPETMSDPYMIFTFNGKDYRVTSGGTDAKGRYLFSFEGVTPEKMGDNICATLYATNASGQVVHVCKETYSVREYCVNTMNKYNNDAYETLQTLLADILVYGAAAQNYTKYNTDALVTEGVSMAHASTFTEVTQTKLAREGTADPDIGWNSASLQCGSKMAMIFSFYTNAPEVTTVEVTVNGRTAVYDIPASAINSTGKYTTVYNGITATEFDDPVTAIIKKDGVQVGETLTYSVNSYVYSMQNNTSVPGLADLVKAIYNYGVSASNYAKQGG